MRDFALPLVFVLVAIAGTWVYFAKLKPSIGRGYVQPAAEVPPPPPPKPAPKPAKRIVAAVEPPAPIATPEPKPAPRVPAPAPKRVATGTPEQVKIGMNAEQVVQILGDPDLKAFSSERGKLVESYGYKPEQGPVTFIRLAAGRVTATKYSAQ